MAKIKVGQDSGTITVTTAGSTRKDYRVTDGTITAHKDDVSDLLAAIVGAELVDGTVDEPVDVDSPPQLPAPVAGALGTPDPAAKPGK